MSPPTHIPHTLPAFQRLSVCGSKLRSNPKLDVNHRYHQYFPSFFFYKSFSISRRRLGRSRLFCTFSNANKRKKVRFCTTSLEFVTNILLIHTLYHYSYNTAAQLRSNGAICSAVFMHIVITLAAGNSNNNNWPDIIQSL